MLPLLKWRLGPEALVPRPKKAHAAQVFEPGHKTLEFPLTPQLQLKQRVAGTLSLWPVERSRVRMVD
jgi:hypothetical protein